MCGIAGVWGNAEREAVREMMELLAHRGPDAEGMHVNGERGVLGHRRLSIMDPAGGDQPLYNENRSQAIVANGEIYNFPQLRRRLQENHRLATGNDSEAVLHLFEEEGMAAVKALDGMFAFAIADGEDLFMARDPLGIKPLYYGMQGGNGEGEVVLFASELKALVGQVDQMHEFPPGSVYHSATGFTTYYEVPEREPRQWPVEEQLKEIRRTLERGVGKRLMSDVPVGAFLSGGLDSSIIAALVRQQVDELHTFSVGIEGARDLEAARLMARQIDSIHHEYVYTAEEVEEKLPEIIYHLESFDQDLVRSAIPCYFCSRMAAEEVKVILTGEGADELFAGYGYYREIEGEEALHRELRRSVTALHNVNLQRVDRLTMAHGLEGRVPFLDLELIELAQEIPVEFKLYGDRRIEKWVLRRACEDLLPDRIAWRDKEQFDEGSGTLDLLDSVLRERAGEIDFESYAGRYPHDGLRSVEECFYHKLFHQVFERPRAVASNVARWAQREI